MSASSTFEVRRARAADAVGAKTVRDRGWLDTYATVPGASVVDTEKRFDLDEFSSEVSWQRFCEGVDENVATFVATAGGEVIGTLINEHGADADKMYAFYVDAAWRGGGVGSSLLLEGLQWLADTGSGQPFGIFVAEHNEQAIEGYQLLGFTIIRTAVANPWGRDRSGTQVVCDVAMRATSAKDVLKVLMSRGKFGR